MDGPVRPSFGWPRQTVFMTSSTLFRFHPGYIPLLSASPPLSTVSPCAQLTRWYFMTDDALETRSVVLLDERLGVLERLRRVRGLADRNGLVKAFTVDLNP